jgi:hypothetical protein
MVPLKVEYPTGAVTVAAGSAAKDDKGQPARLMVSAKPVRPLQSGLANIQSFRCVLVRRPSCHRE